MNKVIWVIVIILVILGIWLIAASGDEVPEEPNPTISEEITVGSPDGVPGDLSGDTVDEIVVTFNGTAFVPAEVRANVGQTVKWINESEKPMWVGSAMHPEHLAYDNTNLATHCAAGYTGPTPFDQCEDGDEYSFTFTKAGDWAYHNHSVTGMFGKVVVAPAVE